MKWGKQPGTAFAAGTGISFAARLAAMLMLYAAAALLCLIAMLFIGPWLVITLTLLVALVTDLRQPNGKPVEERPDVRGE